MKGKIQVYMCLQFNSLQGHFFYSSICTFVSEWTQIILAYDVAPNIAWAESFFLFLHLFARFLIVKKDTVVEIAFIILFLVNLQNIWFVSPMVDRFVFLWVWCLWAGNFFFFLFGFAWCSLFLFLFAKGLGAISIYNVRQK